MTACVNTKRNTYVLGSPGQINNKVLKILRRNRASQSDNFLSLHLRRPLQYLSSDYFFSKTTEISKTQSWIVQTHRVKLDTIYGYVSQDAAVMVCMANPDAPRLLILNVIRTQVSKDNRVNRTAPKMEYSWLNKSVFTGFD